MHNRNNIRLQQDENSRGHSVLIVGKRVFFGENLMNARFHPRQAMNVIEGSLRRENEDFHMDMLLLPIIVGKDQGMRGSTILRTHARMKSTECQIPVRDEKHR